MPPRFPAWPFLFSIALGACANYDFAQARTIDGRIDAKKLIADLQSSGEAQLSDGVWIPLIYTNVTRFERTTGAKPAGYEFVHWVGVGPLFVTGAHEQVLVDRDGTVIEDEDHLWLGWRLLLDDRDERIETTIGPRLESRWRVLALLGHDDVIYAPKN